MSRKAVQILKERISKRDYEKLTQIKNQKLFEFISRYLELCNPDEVFVCADSSEDIQHIRDFALRNKEEAKLATNGHTIHFDGYFDQARDKKNTKFLIPEGVNLGPEINAIDKVVGTKEIHSIMKNIMQGHTLYIKFLCLGPNNSKFSIPCVQLTDSSYVAHSEDLLYRQGFKEFQKLGNNEHFFKFVHSQGEVINAGNGILVSKNVDKRRIYIDLEEEIIYSTNTQYGGNTIGLKKLALRLAINRASKDNWLAEHMLIIGVRGPSERISYFTGAFPSMCGKTSTATLKNVTMVGDDICYLRNINRRIRAVNVEKGLFGILEGINPNDDPLIWRALHKPVEIIFSNILMAENSNAYWNGKDNNPPKIGINHSGNWYLGKKDENGKEITPSHKNARFTFDLKVLDNLDKNINEQMGVEVRGIIYGGRDSSTWPPIEESFDWVHGTITKGASLESETTAAALGKEGVRVFNPMSNLDFLSIPIGKYIENHIDFSADIEELPKIFSVNYFLRDKDGNFLNDKNDKQVWLRWMEFRVHNEVDAIKTPTGYIPRHHDLRLLFKEELKKEYKKEDYISQFTLRIPENLSKIDRMLNTYQTRVLDTPKIVFEVLEKQKRRLEKARDGFGDYISPDEF